VVDPIGARLLTLLERALAPLPPEADPSFAALLQLIRIGQASSAARALDEVLRAGEPPAWLVERHRSLRALVAGTYREVSGITHVTRDLVLARLRGRDLVGALEAARMTGATDLANVLARLVDATDGVLADGRPDEDDPETMPIEGHRLCEFQLRIGALEIAEQGYRAILRSRPGDEKARSRLADLIEVRRALGDEPEPMPPRPPGSVDALRKNAKRAAGAWGKGGAHPRFGDTDNDTTGNLEASQEAELLLKLGKAEAALDVYRILAIRHPKQQIYRRRIAEIEALIAQRLVSSGIEEITVRKDLSALSEKAIPTLPHVKLDELVTFQQDEDDEVTQVDAIPPHRRRE
ncbi:MAG: hypothetical protein K8H88_23650, partial [Sandaracinaceae bacterium]|nr:hypothetical protein [Sandaracinaceae bacterium]